MSPERTAFYIIIGVFVFCLLVLTVIKGPKRIKQEHFRRKWRSLQSRLSDKSQWGTAIVEADDLLAEALKKKRIKGASTGERMVEVQRKLTDNDSVWFGHKLRAKIEANPDIKLGKPDVMKALAGIRQALKDIGVLR